LPKASQTGEHELRLVERDVGLLDGIAGGPSRALGDALETSKKRVLDDLGPAAFATTPCR
jgi:hypothetical protein